MILINVTSNSVSVKDVAKRSEPSKAKEAGQRCCKGQSRTKQGEESRAQKLQQVEDVTREQRSRSREVTADKEKVEELKVVGDPC